MACGGVRDALIFSKRMLSNGVSATVVGGHQRSLSAARDICRETLASVSPSQLVRASVRVVRSEDGEEKRGVHVMRVGDREYLLNHNVKVVAFGKAVLGMVGALESILGGHIVSGVASVPVGSVRDFNNGRKVRIMEGAAHNLPDQPALCAAEEILGVCRGAGEGEVVVAVISGGGSALLPCPIPGVTLDEKRTVTELLSKAGANIKELNMFRKFFSQTKGGKLAEAAYPAQMVGLILSDVIGDPLDTIASGPTTPTSTTHHDIITLTEKYNLSQSLPQSIQDILSRDRNPTRETESPHETVPIENSSYKHVHNVIVGSNRLATEAAAAKAESMGYRAVVWSHSVQGEARLLGEVFATLAHCAAQSGLRSAVSELRKTPCFVNLIRENPAMARDFDHLKGKLAKIAQDMGRPCDICLISGGEPIVTVTGDGKGGRNQELALAFSVRHHQLKQESRSPGPCECVLMSLGTDGQDGPTDAAGALGHSSVLTTATAQGLDGEESLRRNDSHSFFSALDGGRYLLRTGLTGTNVMDIHCLLFTSIH
jgi:glycerate 2-kinase